MGQRTNREKEMNSDRELLTTTLQLYRDQREYLLTMGGGSLSVALREFIDVNSSQPIDETIYNGAVEGILQDLLDKGLTVQDILPHGFFMICTKRYKLPVSYRQIQDFLATQRMRRNRNGAEDNG